MRLLTLFVRCGFLFCMCMSFALTADENSWAQKTLENMSLEEKIGQLFMIAGYVDPEYAVKEIGNENSIRDIEGYVTDYHVGGIAGNLHEKII